MSNTMTVNPVYARKLMFQELTSIQSAIKGLMSMELSVVVTLVTVHCCADYNKQWELAYTTKRQARCLKIQATVYLEAIFRNSDFIAWINLGQDWVYNLYTLYQIKVVDEIGLWTHHGIDHFTLQCANRIQIRVEETLYIVNALGVSTSLTINSILMQLRGNSWTASVLNGLIFNAITTESVNDSLVRNTANYFAIQEPYQAALAYIHLPITSIEQALFDQLGPFISINLIWIPTLAELVSIASAFDSVVRSLCSTNISFQIHIYSSHENDTAPPKWNASSITFYGGNPMCTDGYSLNFVQQSFVFTDGCARTTER
ncbi:hypothetical protein THRCLA_03425 [Thraustotheca clavata]|uniref:Uncharacterized protein n=1 Tax=Thraustotheca clavata TaxID=74557 RepID=A0A1W0A214_9STRA|nr:hypothetical protein THRCLA_03425 [Thraustotheca clavata]